VSTAPLHVVHSRPEHSAKPKWCEVALGDRKYRLEVDSRATYGFRLWSLEPGAAGTQVPVEVPISHRIVGEVFSAWSGLPVQMRREGLER
jgi:hypothetical protein